VELITVAGTLLDSSETSESEATMTDSDDEHVSLEQLANAAKHVEKLLRRITVLQKRCESKAHGKRRIHRMYERFRGRWEASVGAMPTVPPPESLGIATERQGAVPVGLGQRRHLMPNQWHKASYDSTGAVSRLRVRDPPLELDDHASLDSVPIDNAPSAVSRAKHRPTSAMSHATPASQHLHFPGGSQGVAR
jgi:hypothetical protein